jgi:hypothetical protein
MFIISLDELSKKTEPDKTKLGTTHLDQQVEEASIIVATNWCVASHDLLSVNFSLYTDVLSNWQSQDSIFGGKSESVLSGVL